MANFYAFFPTLLKHEGGFVNDPDDPGGATNKGITFGTFKRYAEPYLNIAPTLENLRRLTDEQAGIIYKRRYWDVLRADLIPSQQFANMFFDFFVNAGGNAVKVLQRTLNDAFGASLAVDGGMGDKTFSALMNAPLDRLYTEYKEARAQYYRDLADRNPSLAKFLRGWLNRVASFPDVITDIIPIPGATRATKRAVLVVGGVAVAGSILWYVLQKDAKNTKSTKKRGAK